MKLAASILSFYFLVISAQPVFVELSKWSGACHAEVSGECCLKKNARHECAGKEKSSSNPKQENNCPACCCTVLQCTFCCTTLVGENYLAINFASKSAGIFANADSVLPSSYSSDCWQPPELV